MTAEPRMVSLAIGVSEAKPLKYLSGALNGARAFHAWATALGYRAVLLTDEEEPVTLPKLRDELEKLLASDPADPRPIHRFVIYFAGHGLIREAEEGLWLLSDWHKELRAVAFEVLKRRLYMYGIAQIAIFADACRSLPADIQAADLVADGVLGRGPVKVSKPPAIDKFIAAQDGTATFAVPGNTPEEDRCIFSGVLLEALWGTKPKAFSPVVKDKITSRSLGTFLEEEVPLVAQKYDWQLNPTVVPTFPDGDDIYFGDLASVSAPTFPEWPAHADLIGQGPSRDLGEVGLGQGNRSFGRSGGLESFIDPALEKATRSRAFAQKIAAQERPRAFETQSGFAIDGERVRSVWTTTNHFAEPHGRDNWWRVGNRHGTPPDCVLTDPAPVLIEFANGLFAAITALPKFIGSVLVDGRGVSSLVYREVYAQPLIAGHTEAIIAAMEGGGLRAAEKIDLALELRQDKHVDPTLGVISAYLYDSLGDVDSIRRMAAYYVAHEQPIPFDVAFLARLPGQRQGTILHAHVPDVPAREPQTDRERQFTWAYEATKSCTGSVGGFWPWLRQGWSFLEDPTDDEVTLLLPGLIDLVSHLSSSRFTTLDESGAKELARLFGLAPRS